MTYEEYFQLKAFAKQDGALLSLLWIGALVCYIQGLTVPSLGTLAFLLLLTTPFYAAQRLRHFRDYGRQGVISFRRGYAYTVLLFFYGGLLLALALYVYFQFLDQGFLLGKLTELMRTDANRQAIEQMGMTVQMADGLRQMADMRPIDHALYMLTLNIMAGFFLGVPIAAIMQRRVAANPS